MNDKSFDTKTTITKIERLNQIVWHEVKNESDKTILMCLGMIAIFKPTAFSLKYLINYTGLGQMTVFRRLASLEQRSLVVKSKKGTKVIYEIPALNEF